MCFPLGMAEVIGIVAIIVAVVTLWVMFYLDRKRNPRREFMYDVSASPLVSSEVRGLDKLTVAYDGVPLTQPYLVNMELASTGRADISSSSFDGQKPIIFELNVPIVGEIEHKGSSGTVSAQLKFKEGESSIELPPTLLPAGFSLRASYLCDGKPTVEPKIELTDIPLQEGVRSTTTQASLLTRYSLRFALTIAVTVAGALISTNLAAGISRLFSGP